MYTKEFINKVKELYPNDDDAHQLAENGNITLGMFLEGCLHRTFTPDEVLSIPHEELVSKAQLIKKRIELLEEFNSGACYPVEYMREVMCPAQYMQANHIKDRHDLAVQICNGNMNSLGYFPMCRRWASKRSCWGKYDEYKE